MIRIILFRLGVTANDTGWTEGVLHTFVGENAVVENKATGELQLVPVKPENLKFALLTEKWVQMQVEAQRRAQEDAQQQRQANPNVRFTRA